MDELIEALGGGSAGVEQLEAGEGVDSEMTEEESGPEISRKPWWGEGVLKRLTTRLDETSFAALTGGLSLSQECIRLITEANQETNQLQSVHKLIDRLDLFWIGKWDSTQFEPPYEGFTCQHYHLMADRISRRKDEVLNAVEESMREPGASLIQMQRPGAGERGEALESDLAWKMSQSKYWEVLDMSVEDMYVRLMGVVRVTYDHTDRSSEMARYDGPYSGPVMETIDPRRFVAWPRKVGTLERTVGHGHWAEATLGELRAEMKQAGIEADFSFPGQDGVVEETTPNPRVPSTSIAVYPDSQFVHYFDGLKRFHDKDGKERWFRFMVEKTTMKPLLVTEFPLPTSWYVLGRMMPQRGQIFPESCPGAQLQADQVLYNKIHNDISASIDFRMQPAVYDPTATVTARHKTKKVKPGEQVPYLVRSDTKNQGKVPVHTFGELSSSYTAAEQCERRADRQSHVSETSAGAKSNQTATADMIQEKALATSVKKDLKPIEVLVTGIGRLWLMWLDLYWDYWTQNDKELGIYNWKSKREALREPWDLSLTGLSMAESPTIRMAAVHQVIQFMQTLESPVMTPLEMFKMLVTAMPAFSEKAEVLAKIEAIEQQEEMKAQLDSMGWNDALGMIGNQVSGAEGMVGGGYGGTSAGGGLAGLSADGNLGAVSRVLEAPAFESA